MPTKALLMEPISKRAPRAGTSARGPAQPEAKVTTGVALRSMRAACTQALLRSPSMRARIWLRSKDSDSGCARVAVRNQR
jgi:hypothetical protein